MCAYSSHSIATLHTVGEIVGGELSCAVVYNDAAPTWPAWERPWFLTHTNPDRNWAAWQREDPHRRRLIITQNLFPGSENGADWLALGASGAYAAHARALARNLVAAGQGGAVIRLGHEANGTWYRDSLGTTQRDFDLWRRFWRTTVLAMRSVPGARFRFDWCVNAAVRAIPLASWYPGDDVVDIVGVDAYDAGIRADVPGAERWATVYGRPGGVRDVARFAREHGKPLSIPEWGIGPRGGTAATGGDDPEYVRGILGVARANDVAYQAYFYSGDWAAQLDASPRSRDAYRAGAGGA